MIFCRSGSGKGAALYVVPHGRGHGWTLYTSPYCVEETRRNLSKLTVAAARVWQKKVHPHLALVSDELVLDVIYDTGHHVPEGRSCAEIAAWLDRYLGPVR